jgi:hypothetical protein
MPHYTIFLYGCCVVSKYYNCEAYRRESYYTCDLCLYQVHKDVCGTQSAGGWSGPRGNSVCGVF